MHDELHSKLTFMPCNHGIRDACISSIFCWNGRKEKIRVADASSDDLYEDLVVPQRAHGEVLHFPILAGLVVGARSRSNDRSRGLGDGRHCSILEGENCVKMQQGQPGVEEAGEKAKSRRIYGVSRPEAGQLEVSLLRRDFQGAATNGHFITRPL